MSEDDELQIITMAMISVRFPNELDINKMENDISDNNGTRK